MGTRFGRSVMGFLLFLSACAGGAHQGKGGHAAKSTGCGAAGDDLEISAKGTKFDVSCLAVTADRPFTIHFSNQDAGVQHNVAIFKEHPMEGASNGDALFRGELISDAVTIIYHVAPLPAGSYHFHCDVHPKEMSGTLVVK